MKFIAMRFIATRGFISDAIMRVEGISYIDHVEAMNRTGDKWIGAHAGTGVQARPLDWAKDIVWERRYALPVTDEECEDFHAFLESKIGAKYDYAGCLGLLLGNRKIDAPQTLDCSALQFDALWVAGQRALNVVPEFAHLVTPETLHLSNLWIGCFIPRPYLR